MSNASPTATGLLVRATVCAAFAAASVLFFIMGDLILGIFEGVVALGCLATTLIDARSFREHRRAERDRERAGPDSDDTGAEEGDRTFTGLGASAGLVALNPLSSHPYTVRVTASNTSGPMVASLGWGHMVRQTVGTLDLPAREGDLPILAYKAAFIAWRPGGRFTLTGLMAGGDYEPIGTARCESGAPHEAPDQNCVCGFYASQDRGLVYNETPDAVMLDVELYGRVIVHEFGYRAQKQRVLRASAQTRCKFCGQHAGLLVLPDGYDRDVDITYTKGALSFRCEQHVGPQDVAFSLEFVCAELGLELERVA